MRIIIDDASSAQLVAAMELIVMAHLHVSRGSIITDAQGQRGVLAVDDKDAPKAVEILTRSGIPARMESE